MGGKKKFGIYLHIPYCRRKCLYCDFYSGGMSGADWPRFVNAMLRECEERKGEMKGMTPHTLYIGGGTPSLLPSVEFRRLVGGIAEIFGFDPSGLREFTVEVNPEDVTPEMCSVWRDAGVNRVSMGVQSFIEGELRLSGRRHSTTQTEEAYRIIRDYFDNISLDLIFGLPGQTLESLGKSLDRMVGLHPEHVSVYSLMLEEGTAMTELCRTGRLKTADDELSLRMFEAVTAALEKGGYRQYEISNYSQPGFESIHNSSYWRGLPYLGLGPSAHSYDGDRIRRANPADLKGWLIRFGGGNAEPDKSALSDSDTLHNNIDNTPYYLEERLTDTELLEEMILTRMRTREGLDLNEVHDRFGERAAAHLVVNALNPVTDGRLTIDNEHLCLTRRGIMSADDVILTLAMD